LGLEEAVEVLGYLSKDHAGIVSVATKGIWESLIDKMKVSTLIVPILKLFSNLACSRNDQEIVLQLINLRLLEAMKELLTLRLSVDQLACLVHLINNMMQVEVLALYIIVRRIGRYCSEIYVWAHHPYLLGSHRPRLSPTQFGFATN
jgi:hypothetical protein